MALLRVHLTIAVLLPSCVSSTFPPLNATTIARVDSAILTAFSLPANGTYGVYCNPCANGDAIGSLVRLPFHDAVGGGRPGGKGGPNGCIDFTFAGNNGLQEVVGILETAYTAGGFASLLSKADFWVLAGNTAVRIASMLPPGTLPEGGLPMPDPEPLLLPFHYGRVDDATCDGVDGAFLPAVQASYADTAASFCSRVGMTPRQLVAIMGAPTVGRAQGSDLPEQGVPGGDDCVPGRVGVQGSPFLWDGGHGKCCPQQVPVHPREVGVLPGIGHRQGIPPPVIEHPGSGSGSSNSSGGVGTHTHLRWIPRAWGREYQQPLQSGYPTVQQPLLPPIHLSKQLMIQLPLGSPLCLPGRISPRAPDELIPGPGTETRHSLQ